MWENLIFIDYDVGAFGNTLVSLIITTSKTPSGSLYGTPYGDRLYFSPVGDSHAIRSSYIYSSFEFGDPTKLPDIPIYIQDVNKPIIIIGHANGREEELLNKYPGAQLIRIYPDRETWVLQTISGYKKFSGYPTIESIDSIYKNSWEHFENTEVGFIECLSKNYYDYLKKSKIYKIPAIMISLNEILSSEFKTIINLFEIKFGFEFDYSKIPNFIREWKRTNSDLITRANLIETICNHVKNDIPMDISSLNLTNYEKSLIITNLAYDLNFDVMDFQFHTSDLLNINSTKQIYNALPHN